MLLRNFYSSKKRIPKAFNHTSPNLWPLENHKQNSLLKWDTELMYTLKSCTRACVLKAYHSAFSVANKLINVVTSPGHFRRQLLWALLLLLHELNPEKKYSRLYLSMRSLPHEPASSSTPTVSVTHVSHDKMNPNEVFLRQQGWVVLTGRT